jgi:ferredoxin
MPHVIETAKTGRSGCRTCGHKIEKGLVRFGEEVANAFDPDGGTTHHWHHLLCAAQKRPHAVNEVLAAGPTPEGVDRVALDAALAQGLATARPPFPFAEHASTGRSRCQGCRTAIEKGELRVAVPRPSDMMPNEAAAYVHVRCAAAHVQDPELLVRVLRHSRGLSDDDTAALRAALAPG